jgi:hypothetical protein
VEDAGEENELPRPSRTFTGSSEAPHREHLALIGSGRPQILCGPRLFEQAELCGRLTERVARHGWDSRRYCKCLMSVVASGDVSFLVAGMVGTEGSVVDVDLDSEAIRSPRSRAL